MAEKKSTGLELLRKPFEAHQIGKLPKPTKKQTEKVRNDWQQGIRCGLCGAWHHPDVVHLDYVGHAALTDRLLDCDPNWNWEPTAWTENGQPARDENGGMWIKLTVCGVTRLGYGDAGGKRGGDANKELIGDALRNAAMRFGAALDLWHKGDLHVSDDHDDPPIAEQTKSPAKQEAQEAQTEFDVDGAVSWLEDKVIHSTLQQLRDFGEIHDVNLRNLKAADETKWNALRGKVTERIKTLEASGSGQAPAKNDLEDIPY